MYFTALAKVNFIENRRVNHLTISAILDLHNYCCSFPPPLTYNSEIKIKMNMKPMHNALIILSSPVCAI